MKKRYFEYASVKSSSNSHDPNKSYNERRFESENKKASDRLRKSIQALSVEEQIDRKSEIDEIASGKQFKSEEFVSKRKITQIDTKDNIEEIDLNSIPLPKNVNDWRENPQLLIKETFFNGTSSERLEAWKDIVRSYKNK